MLRRLLWALLAGAVLVAVVLVSRHDQSWIGPLTTGDAGMLGYQLVWAAAIGGAVIMLFRGRLSAALGAALLWIVIGVLLVFAYSYRGELHSAGERVLAELVPGRPSPVGAQGVEIVRGRGGDFQVAAQVNGTRVFMVLDTGASTVVLTHEAAKAAGLPLEVMSYTVAVDTANGRARAAAVTLDRLAVGSIVEHGVAALVAQPGQLRTSLLGMSFLDRLGSWEVRGDRLVMRGKP